MKNPLISTIILLFLLCLLTSCGSSLHLHTEGDAYLNPDVNNQSLPVVVKVYQLSDDRAFKTASFDTLWTNYQASLGKNLLSEEDVMVMPNSDAHVTLSRISGAEYVGFVAVFRSRGSDSQWKVVQPISSFALFGHHYRIRVQGNSIQVD